MLSGCVELVESFEGVFVQRGMVVARVRSWGVRGVVKRRARLHVINIIYLTYMYIYSEWGGGPTAYVSPSTRAAARGPAGPPRTCYFRCYFRRRGGSRAGAAGGGARPTPKLP